jgi:hypothetical protein
MRRTILLSLFVLFAAVAAHNACAQRRGGAGHGSARSSGYRAARRARYASPYGFGYWYAPYDFDTGYTDAPQPVLSVQQPPTFVEPPAPSAVPLQAHPEVTEYKWPTVGAASSPSASESQSFAIVLKDGSTLSAVMVFASDDGLHYVDPDQKHLRISISEIDRAATLKLNRARSLNLQLPAAQ